MIGTGSAETEGSLILFVSPRHGIDRQALRVIGRLKALLQLFRIVHRHQPNSSHI